MTETETLAELSKRAASLAIERDAILAKIAKLRKKTPVDIRRQENLDTWWGDVVHSVVCGWYGRKPWCAHTATDSDFNELCRRIQDNRQHIIDFRWLPYAGYRLEPIPEICIEWDKKTKQLHIWPIWSSVPSLMWDSVDWWHENHPMNCEEWAWMKGEPGYEPSF